MAISMSARAYDPRVECARNLCESLVSCANKIDPKLKKERQLPRWLLQPQAPHIGGTGP